MILSTANGDMLSLAVFAVIPVIVAAIGAIYYQIARRTDKLDGRFDELGNKIEKMQIDISKTNVAVSYIRGQLSGTATQRRRRRDIENGGVHED